WRAFVLGLQRGERGTDVDAVAVLALAAGALEYAEQRRGVQTRRPGPQQRNRAGHVSGRERRTGSEIVAAGRRQTQDVASRGIQHGARCGARCARAAGFIDRDDTGDAERKAVESPVSGYGPDEYHAAMLAKADQLRQQRIGRSAEAQVDDLRVRLDGGLQRQRQGKGIALRFQALWLQRLTGFIDLQ